MISEEHKTSIERTISNLLNSLQFVESATFVFENNQYSARIITKKIQPKPKAQWHKDGF